MEAHYCRITGYEEDRYSIGRKLRLRYSAEEKLTFNQLLPLSLLLLQELQALLYLRTIIHCAKVIHAAPPRYVLLFLRRYCFCFVLVEIMCCWRFFFFLPLVRTPIVVSKPRFSTAR